MSGFEALNIFGRLTNINRTKVDFVQADVNNDGQVTQEEFRNIESMCNIDSDKITFGGVDKNGDGVIVESEWKTIQVGMDMQSVLNQIQGAISRELCGVDSVLQEELAEYLAQRTNDWATIVNMNLDNAKDVFKTYIEGEMQNWLNANNSRRPSVIIQTVAAELLNGDPDAGVAGYLDSATQSDYHQRLITEAINSFARSWMECNYTNYDNATDLANALRAAVQAYMSEVTNEQNGTTRLDDIQSQAIAHEQAIADASVNTIVRQINDITNANPQDFVNRIDTAITYLQSLDLNGDTEAQAYVQLLLNGLNNARGICSQILTDMNAKLALAQQEQQAAANAATSKEAAQHAAAASQYQSDADELFATFNQTKLEINNLLNDVHTIEQCIANGTTIGGTTTGGTTGGDDPEVTEGTFTNAQLRSRNSGARQYVQTALADIKSELLAQGYNSAKLDEAVAFLTELYEYRISNATSAGEGITIDKAEMKEYILNYFRSGYYSTEGDAKDLQILNEYVAEENGTETSVATTFDELKTLAKSGISTVLDDIKTKLTNAGLDTTKLNAVHSDLTNDYNDFLSNVTSASISYTTSGLTVEYPVIVINKQEIAKRFKRLYMWGGGSTTQSNGRTGGGTRNSGNGTGRTGSGTGRTGSGTGPSRTGSGTGRTGGGTRNSGNGAGPSRTGSEGGTGRTGNGTGRPGVTN